MSTITEYFAPQPGPQLAAIDTRHFVDELLYGGARGGGKLIDNNDLCLTPFGWKRHGDMRPGDQVVNPTTGGVSRVVAFFPQGVKPLYEIVFDDGAKVRAGLEHLWAYKLPNRKRPRTKKSSQREYASKELGAEQPDGRWNNYNVGTTADLINALKNGLEPRIPLTEPVLFSVNGRTGTGIPPYLCGLLLGDGHLDTRTITNVDKEIQDYLISIGFSLRADNKSLGATGDIKKQIAAWIRNNGLDGKHSWDKFIPKYVFTAPIEYRMEFLRGLMDSDGYVDERGRCYYTSVSLELANGVRNLVWAFGGKAGIREKHPTYTYKGEKLDGRVAYDVNIYIKKTSALFNLTRKKDRCTDSWNGGYENMRKVVSIEHVFDAECSCITVDNPFGLYITNDFIVTHNSFYLIIDFAVDMEQFGENFHGIIFRKSYPRLDELVKISTMIFKRCYPAGHKCAAEFKVGSYTWVFANGSTLKFRHLENDYDADNYQGHSYQWIAFDELGEWATAVSYNKMKATLRGGGPGVPKRMRATANPGGVGHGWIKQRFIDQNPNGHVLTIDPDTGEKRMFIPSKVTDNKLLLRDDPGYPQRIKASCEGNEQLERAWLDGSWDVFFGSFFEMFSPQIHKIDPLKDLPGGRVPDHWRLEGGLDYGEAQHTAFGLFATDENGTSYLLEEYYEKGLWVDEHAGRIKDLIQSCVWTNGRIPERVWADPAIFTTRSASGLASVTRHVSDVFKLHGIRVIKSHKDRLTGWRYLKNELAWKKDPLSDGFLKKPRLFYLPNCENFERTMRSAVYGGTQDQPKEDMDTEGEDHIPDMVRYWVMGAKKAFRLPEDIKPAHITFGDLLKRNIGAREGYGSPIYGYYAPRERIIDVKMEGIWVCGACHKEHDVEFMMCQRCGAGNLEWIKKGIDERGEVRELVS